MAIVIEDLPPLMWHAELGRSLPDMWSGTHQRGAQLHDLRDAVIVWASRYGQRAWLRQLEHPVTREVEDAVLRTIARLDGTPFPSTTRLAWRWLRGRAPNLGRPTPPPARAPADGAEIAPAPAQARVLLRKGPRSNWSGAGGFGRGDALPPPEGPRLAEETPVHTPPPPRVPAPPPATHD